MKYQVVDDGTWFDIDASTRYAATDGSSETLYKTVNGNFILATVDEFKKVTCKKISKDHGFRWMVLNDRIEELPREERETREI